MAACRNMDRMPAHHIFRRIQAFVRRQAALGTDHGDFYPYPNDGKNNTLETDRVFLPSDDFQARRKA